MIKRVLLATVFVLALFPFQINAQGIEKGYHGFVDAGYSFEVLGGTLGFDWVEVNTIHGYQATPNIFIGAGMGLHFFPEVKRGHIRNDYYMWVRNSSMEIPLFADFRWTVLNKKITPFVDLRAGHCVSDGSGTYLSAGAGGRLTLKNNMGVYLMISYSTHQKVEYSSIEECNSAITARLGFDF